MNEFIRKRRCRLLVLGICLCSPSLLQAADKPSARVQVTRYDLATREDLLLGYLIAPQLSGDVPGWTILTGLSDQVGGWITQYLDARHIAGIITTSMPIEGQPALGSLDKLVTGCAARLNVDKPVVHVRASPFMTAYAVKAFGRNHLVLTSGLLNLYEGRPEELKFVVGHELGHIKCEHQELKRNAYGIVTALQAIDLAIVPDKFQNVLPTLGLGRLLSWCRASEISADRAGLLCCEDPKIAYQAMMRLLHGLNPQSKWIDASSSDFNPDAIIKDFQEWQYRPLVKFLVDIKRHQLESPFVPERLAALRSWVDAGDFRKLSERIASPQPTQLIEIRRIAAFELTDEGKTIDPYVIVFDGRKQVLRTAAGNGVRQALWEDFHSTDKGVEQPRTFSDGCPLYCEIWDDNILDDAFVGGFVIFPSSRDAVADASGHREAEYEARIQWDWKEAKPTSRAGFTRVRVRFLDRQVSPNGSSRKRGKDAP